MVIVNKCKLRKKKRICRSKVIVIKFLIVKVRKHTRKGVELCWFFAVFCFKC